MFRNGLVCWFFALLILFFTASCGNSKTGGTTKKSPPPPPAPPTTAPSPTPSPSPTPPPTWEGYLKNLKTEDGKPLYNEESLPKVLAYYKKLKLDISKFAPLNDYLMTLQDTNSTTSEKLFPPVPALRETEHLLLLGTDSAPFIAIHKALESDLQKVSSGPRDRETELDVIDASRVISQKEKDPKKVDSLYDQFIKNSSSDAKIASAEAIREIRWVYESKTSVEDFQAALAYIQTLKTSAGTAEYDSQASANAALEIVNSGVKLDQFKAAHAYFRSLKNHDDKPLTSFDLDLTLTMVEAQGFDLDKFKTAYEKYANEKDSSGTYVYSSEKAFRQACRDLNLDVALEGIFG